MVQTDLSKYDNSWFHIGARRLKVVVWYFINVFFLNCSWNPSSGLKVRLLRIFGANIGKGVVIKPSVNIKYPWNLSIGDYSWIGENVWIDNLVQVTIGSNVCISQGAMLLCGNHNYKLPTFDLIVKPIVIENGAWVGAKSTVSWRNYVLAQRIVCRFSSIQRSCIIFRLSWQSCHLCNQKDYIRIITFLTF